MVKGPEGWRIQNGAGPEVGRPRPSQPGLRESGEPFHPLPCHAARRTVFWFVVFGAAWILVSDLVVRLAIADPSTRAVAQTAKGWLFIAASALLLAALLRREIRRGAAAQTQVEHLRRGLDLIFTSADEAMLLTGRDGRILEANPAAGALLRLEASSLRGQDLQSFVRIAGEPETDRAMRRWGALPGDTVVAGADEPRLATLSVTPEVAPGLDLVILRDVTEHRALERRLRRAERREAMGRIAGGAAHDFNNLLTVIIGHCELAASSLTEPERLEASLAEIRRSGRRGVELTRELLTLGRGIDQDHVRPIRLDVLVEDLVPSATALVGGEHRLELERSGEALWTRADPAQLERVLMNLLANARDASPSGSAVRLCTGTLTCRRGKAGPFRLAPGTYVRASVIDRGTGMDAETRRRIFEPYYSTKQGGTGLGLAVAERIVADLGGAIHVESAPERGSRFDMVLPRIEPSATAGSSPAGPSMASQR